MIHAVGAGCETSIVLLRNAKVETRRYKNELLILCENGKSFSAFFVDCF